MFNTETLYEHVMIEMCRRRGLPYADEMRRQMMGLPAPHAFGAMIRYYGLDVAWQTLQVECDEIFTALLHTDLAPMPGLLELLDLLESKCIPKGIATSSRRQFPEFMLGKFNLAHRFAFVLTAEDVTHGKPDPEIYLKAIARHGTSAPETLVLEDSVNGLRAAVAAGAMAVAIPGSLPPPHEYPGAAFIANELTDPRILELFSG